MRQVLLCVLSIACLGVGTTSVALSDPNSQLVSIGRSLFFDDSLSEPAGTSCARCHDPKQAYSGNHGSTNGVALGSRPNVYAKRNTPSVMYLKFVPAFHFHWEEDAAFPDPAGGFFWDGRADTIPDVVPQPLTNPNEMGHQDANQILKKVEARPYAEAFYRTLKIKKGDAPATLHGIGVAIEAFLDSDSMSPFTSKYDDYIHGHAVLSASEKRGLEIFKNPAKGNCVSCHLMDDTSPDPTRSLFTDYGYENAGFPRNLKLPQNADPKFYDLGICERHESPLTSDTRLCGQFRTPSLRNVAVRHYFMHNGVFHDLREAVRFYATRNTDPNHWYPNGLLYNDLPAEYRNLVNVITVPYTRRLGDSPLLSDQDIDDLVAFLKTLTDAEFR